MDIREILPWDRTAFLALVQAFYALPAVAHPLPPSHAARTFDLLMSDTPYARCFLTVDEKGTPQGYCLCAVTWSNEAGGLCVWIEEVYVAEAFRSHGIGRALIDAVRHAYPNAARLRLEVTAENGRARALYEALGFADLPYTSLVIDAPPDS